MTLKTTCGEGEDAKAMEVSYLVVDIMSPYNIILGYPAINALGEAISTRYLVLKYPMLGG